MHQVQTTPDHPKKAAGYIGLSVTDSLRDRLRDRLSPSYSAFKGDHITLKLGAKEPSEDTTVFLDRFRDVEVEVYGTADDGFAVQCFLVRVNGRAADDKGRSYHLTWSIDPEVEVPAAYNANAKPCKAKSMHAAYVAAQPELAALWLGPDIIKARLSAHFYPQIENAAVIAADSGPVL